MPGEKSNVDHIIPLAFFSKVARSSHQYEHDWNCQPMHAKCNQQKAAELEEWPRFHCRCHFLQVEEGHLFVMTRGQPGTERHILLTDIVSESRDKVDAKLVVGPEKIGGRKVVGYSRIKSPFGYLLSGIARSRVDLFNLHERMRVGLPTPDAYYVTEDGRVIPLGPYSAKPPPPEGDYSLFPSL